MPNSLNAQSAKDSVARIARSDVKKYYRLPEPALKKFKKYKHTSNADYFRPSRENVSNPLLLQDSAYVAAYRTAAYERTKARRTVGHYLLIGGISFVSAIAIVGTALVSGGLKS
ncbi:MAG: hypothetical protein REI78_08125 [Pedobacter sp.]|nr:hypothetical protein [Pedobacter sp.]MDQ8052980.1 hypothetical protein [Pedobacter sp.]